MAQQQTERRLDDYIECILDELRQQLPAVLSSVGSHGVKIIIHIHPQASAVRIELPPSVIEVRRRDGG